MTNLSGSDFSTKDDGGRYAEERQNLRWINFSDTARKILITDETLLRSNVINICLFSGFVLNTKGDSLLINHFFTNVVTRTGFVFDSCNFSLNNIFNKNKNSSEKKSTLITITLFSNKNRHLFSSLFGARLTNKDYEIPACFIRIVSNGLGPNGYFRMDSRI